MYRRVRLLAGRVPFAAAALSRRQGGDVVVNAAVCTTTRSAGARSLHTFVTTSSTATASSNNKNTASHYNTIGGCRRSFHQNAAAPAAAQQQQQEQKQHQGGDNSGGGGGGRHGRAHYWGAYLIPVSTTAAAGAALWWWASSEVQAAAKEQTTFDKLKKSMVENYDNRIRAYSSPEKVFATFASVEKDGELHMTPDDFLHSLMPLLGEGDGVKKKRRKYRPGQRVPEVFRLADSDGDGLLSFSEYIFFITLLSIPESHFHVAFAMFDLDCSGSIDLQEFQNFMDVMQKHSPSASKQRSAHVGLSNAALREKDTADQRDGGSSDGGGSSGSASLFPMFFGEDGLGELTYPQFYNFLRALQDATLQLEFDHFDRRGSGYIRGKDFALSLISHVDPKLLDEYKSRALDPPHSRVKVDFKTFHSFNEFLRRVDELEVALDAYYHSHGELDKESFCRAARAVASIELPWELVDIVFHVFDRNGDGSLDKSEFIRVIQQKNGKGLRRSRDVGMIRMFKCIKECVAD